MIRWLADITLLLGVGIASVAIDVIGEMNRQERRRELEAHPNYCATCDDIIRLGEWHYSTCPRQADQEEDPNRPGWPK